MKKPAYTVLFIAAGALLLVGAIKLLFGSGSATFFKRPPEVAQSGVGFKDISSQQLQQMLSQKDFFFVNVHIPYEGEIEKTDAFIVYSEINKNLATLPKDKKAKIVLYCRSGAMSKIAAETLANLDYSNVYNLTGGMVNWEKQGYNLIKNPR